MKKNTLDQNNIVELEATKKPKKKPEVTAEEGNQKAAPKVIKALLIDDNYDFFQVTKTALEGKMDLDYAGDGFSAFQMVRREDYDVVICDIYMPFLSGITLLDEFNKKNIKIPFVFVTGNLSEKITREALQMGAYNFLEKPFPIPELILKCERALELHQKEEFTHISEQDRAYIYNTLKTYYYDIEKIMRSIQHFNLPVSFIHEELDKKIRSGKCIFDDLQNLKYLNHAS